MKTLVTFDIDGTILRGLNRGMTHKDAFRYAMNTMFHVDYPIGQFLSTTVAGKTDLGIITSIIEKASGNITQDQINQFRKLTENHFLETFDGHVYVFPGIPEILEELSQKEDVQIGLVTGNFPLIAKRKLQAAGLDKYFSDESLEICGSEIERAQILKNAIDKAGDIKRVIHVGDTPSDVIAAQKNNGIAIAVKTSYHKFNAEEFPQPCIILENLKSRHDVFMSIVNEGKPPSGFAND